VLPTSLMGADLDGLVEYLTSEDPVSGIDPSVRFDTIWLEYGNEAWGAATQGDPFWGSSVNGGTRLGQLSAAAFTRIRAHPDFDPALFQLVVGGQAGWFGQNELIEAAGDQHDSLAIAPYYLGDPDELGGDDAAFLDWALAQPYHAREDLQEFHDLVTPPGHSLTIYELNFHTTGGGLDEGTRNDWVTSRVGGELLARTMLMNQRDLQMPVQNAFALAQYSYHYGGGYVRLWGMVRDLTATERLRPTFLAVTLVNQVMGPEALEVTLVDPDGGWTHDGLEIPSLDAWAWRWEDGCGAVLVNTNPTEARDVVLTLPAACADEWQCERLSGDPLDDNEDAEGVVVQDIPCAPGTPVTLPAGSLTTVLAGEAAPADDDTGDDDTAGDDDAADDDDTAADDAAGGDCGCREAPGPGRAPTVLALLTALGAALALRRRSP
jgi:hypothetical protein